MQKEQTLIVIGGGPKALAIAAKRLVLAELGMAVPQVVVIDKAGVGANWSGAFGFTDGEQILGTPPEKDVGFPYDSRFTINGSPRNTEINRAMHRYSWASYLISSGTYGEWIDRSRPHPTHKQFQNYLKWVASQVKCEPVLGEASLLSVDGGRWKVTVKSGSRNSEVSGQGLVITGPGVPKKTLQVTPADDPRVLDGQQFWSQLPALKTTLPSRASVAVVGAGETAAATIVALLDNLGDKVSILSVSRQGIFSRGESFHENTLFTTPNSGRGIRWETLPETQRMEFVRRTDRSVFSLHAQARINHAPNVLPLLGEAESVTIVEDRAYLKLRETAAVHVFDLIVDATGFDPLWFVKRFDANASKLWFDAIPNVEPKSRRGRNYGHIRNPMRPVILNDVTLRGFSPALFLPMLSGIDLGPGFPNLSCLGRLSDAILGHNFHRNYRR